MSVDDTGFRNRVLLSVQRALIGEVTPQMRFIGVEISTERIHLIVWHDGPVDADLVGPGGDFDAGVVSEVFAEQPWPECHSPEVSSEFVRCDSPENPWLRGHLVYGRHEPYDAASDEEARLAKVAGSASCPQRLREPRPPFAEAVAGFRQFLTEIQWSDQVRWLSAADITGYRNRLWVYRPMDIANERSSEEFYNAAIATPASVRIDGIFQHAGFTFAWVEIHGGHARFLNYGVWTSPILVAVVRSSVVWGLRRRLNRIRGESPFLRDIVIPKSELRKEGPTNAGSKGT
jgi:hypothetical protein